MVKKTFFQSIHSCRGIAALSVVLYHLGEAFSFEEYFANPLWKTLFSFGSFGIEFFFVLSGFIILAAHREETGSSERLFPYLKKRMLRIYPTYRLVFLPLMGATHLLPSLAGKFDYSVPELLKAFLLIPQNVETVGGSGAPIVVVAWTLQYEMIFYLFFAALFFGRTFAKAVLALLCLLWTALFFLGEAPFPLSFFTEDYFWLFLMGMVVNKLVNRGYSFPFPKFLLGVGLGMFTGMSLDIVTKTQYLDAFRVLIFGLSCALILYSLVVREQGGKVFLKSSGLAKLLGSSSYSIYLIHYPLISVFCKVFKKFSLTQDSSVFIQGVLFTFCFLGVVSAGALFHIFLEKPVIRFLRRKVEPS
jgi:peptidoglycan/LPS O-acetylase OafA/YrhL